MIDTSKYDGHSPAPWLPAHDLVETGYREADAKLIADAPLLLAEVKRLYELHTLVGVPIPWKVEYGDGGGYETFVADAVVWNYDDSGEWGLVNYNETRWMTLETAKEWMEMKE